MCTMYAFHIMYLSVFLECRQIVCSLLLQVFQSGNPKADEIVFSNMTAVLDRIFLDVEVKLDFIFCITDNLYIFSTTLNVTLWIFSISELHFSGALCVLTISQSIARAFWLLHVWSKLHSAFSWFQVSWGFHLHMGFFFFFYQIHLHMVVILMINCISCL